MIEIYVFDLIFKYFLYFCNQNILINVRMERKINRIKVMLAEKGKTNKWLSEQVGKDPATVSKFNE